MADWVKRIHRFRGEDLDPGEQVRAAVLLHPSGNSRRLSAGAVGGVLGVLIAARVGRAGRERPVAPAGGVAATIPDGPLVVGVTDTRILVFGQSATSGRPTVLRVVLARDAVASIDVGTGVFRDVTFAFADGTSRRFETPGTDRSIDRFVAELS